MIHDSAGETETSSESRAPDRLLVGAYGWRHEHWLDNFYPDDLPEDWQLGFYANEFPAILVPAEECTAESYDPLDWLDEVDESFRFFIELPDSAEQETIRDKSEVLGAQLAGFFYQDREGAQEAIQERSGIAVIELGSRSMREWKNWLQDKTDVIDAGNLTAIFLSDRHLQPEQLREFKTLVELMGL